MAATLAMMMVVSIVPVGTHAQSTHKNTRRKTSSTQNLAEEMREMREDLQKQIDDLKRQLADRDAKLEGAHQAVQSADAKASEASEKAAAATASAAQNAETVTALQNKVEEVNTAEATEVKAVQEKTDKLAKSVESPLAIHYKGIEITPGGFFAAETTYRTRSLNSDINTPFNATPYNGAAEAKTSEFNGSARQSRLSLLAAGKTNWGALRGYFEGDFLSAGVTSNSNQSNSYTFRVRQFFGQVALNSGFTLTGGQTWSLVTETKTSTDARTEVLPQTPDAAYHVGFSWTRQYSLRAQQKLGIYTVAGSIEEAQNIFSASNQNQNFFFGSAGVSGGLFNAFNGNYINNVAPDIIVKVTADPKFGHFEVGGLGRFFRDRYYPGVTGTTSVPVTTPAANDTKTGGGIFANAHIPMTKYFTLGLHGLQGVGVGRYGTSTLPDTTVHPDGTLAPIRNSQGLVSLEFHLTPKLDVYGYGGGEYAQRTVYLDPVSKKLVGYAPITVDNSGCNTEYTPTGNTGYLPAPATKCTGATRAIFEGSAGFVYRFYSSPTIGRVQYSIIYSYLTREGWTGTTSPTTFGAPKATNNMVFTSFRYYLP